MRAVTAKKTWARIEEQKRESTGQLLLKCARLLDEEAVARVNEEGVRPALRPAHTRLFPHIDPAGTRLTELARRVGITKQAVGQLVDELVQLEALEVVPDPEDRRARRVRFSQRGLQAIGHGLRILGALEGEITERVGSKKMKVLQQTLSEVLAALEEIRSGSARPE